MSLSLIRISALVSILGFASLVRAQEQPASAFTWASTSASADALAARGARYKRAGVALITIAALLDVAVTGLAIAAEFQCSHGSDSCRGPFDAGLSAAVTLHTVALGVGIPLYAVGKSKLSRAALSPPRWSVAPVSDARGPTGAMFQLAFSR